MLSIRYRGDAYEAFINRWEMTDGVRDKKSILHSFYV